MGKWREVCVVHLKTQIIKASWRLLLPYRLINNVMCTGNVLVWPDSGGKYLYLSDMIGVTVSLSPTLLLLQMTLLLICRCHRDAFYGLVMRWQHHDGVVRDTGVTLTLIHSVTRMLGTYRLWRKIVEHNSTIFTGRKSCSMYSFWPRYRSATRTGLRRSEASSLELFNRRAEDGVEVNDDDHMLRRES